MGKQIYLTDSEIDLLQLLITATCKNTKMSGEEIDELSQNVLKKIGYYDT